MTASDHSCPVLESWYLSVALLSGAAMMPLCFGQHKDVVNGEAQQQRSNQQQCNPHTPSLETLADRNQQQHGCQGHCGSHVLIGDFPPVCALFEDLCRLVI
jgi:hypothetical protein